MKTSICTLGFGRDTHLANMLRGLRQSRRPPGEVVIAVMGDTRYDVPDTSFPVRQILMGSQDIPVARARNSAARAAGGEALIFLDIDCIPHPDLVGDYVAAMERRRGVFMGEVGHLPRGAADHSLDFDELERQAGRHSERPLPPATSERREADNGCFWSLSFAMRAVDFAATGGFDENCADRGDEDADFGRACASRGIPLWWLRGAKAYRLHHKLHTPPDGRNGASLSAGGTLGLCQETAYFGLKNRRERSLAGPP